jgi:hypothetical protein
LNSETYPTPYEWKKVVAFALVVLAGLLHSCQVHALVHVHVHVHFRLILILLLAHQTMRWHSAAQPEEEQPFSQNPASWHPFSLQYCPLHWQQQKSLKTMPKPFWKKG